VHRGDLNLLRVVRLRFESVDHRGVFEDLDRKVAEVPLQAANASRRGVQAANAGSPEVSLEVGVEETSNVLEILRRLLRRRLDARVTSGLDFADEQPLPIARLFHRLDRLLLTLFHAGYRKVVHLHAIPDTPMLHVEPQMLQASPSIPARSSAASSDCHLSSFRRFIVGWLLRDPCWRAPCDPVEHISRMKPPLSHAESL
jgi:hypothetical protein